MKLLAYLSPAPLPRVASGIRQKSFPHTIPTGAVGPWGVLLLALFACTSPLDPEPLAVDAGLRPFPGPVRPICATRSVLLVGDSLTVGAPDGYRAALSVLGRGDIEFVGPLCSGQSAAGDCEHAAVAGARIDQIAPMALAAAEDFVPEVVLLWAGTNDVVQGYEPVAAVGRLLDLRNEFEGMGMEVLVATLPPIKPAACAGACEPRRKAFDAALLAAEPGAVRLDLAVTYPVDYVDFAHPSERAQATKIAPVWYGALVEVE